MRKVCLVLFSIFLCIDGVNAASRTQNNLTPSVSRQATTRTKTESRKNRSVSSRTSTTDTIRKTSARTASSKIVSGRTSTQKKATRASRQPSLVSRATAITQTKTFDTNYNTCRDAYFSCMDQFCATLNEDYRRCVCSSKLQSIKKQEKTLSQTDDSLKDFENLNIDAISKTSKEVHAMLTASDGESAIKKDTSQSANTLENISSVLKNAKSKSLSTSGQLDIAGDIKSIWNTTDLIGGTDITNLTGEALYNAVHAQCSELVAPSCASTDFKMIASAYGMYIENDCAILETNNRTKKTTANANIRDTRHKMQDTRLENYNAHNSVDINECIANVRKDITADSACGDGYIHCLDFSGKYLNLTTGAPIYSPEFYQIENQISLSGDVLNNNQNAGYVNALNKKRNFATKSLDLCRDNADEVWDEFMRQAIVEIYQGQQEKVKIVKDECLAVVNDCYLKQSEQIKEFSSTDTKINLNQTLKLASEMCADKLTTCSNLYGGGEAGFEILIATMTGITNTTVEQSCSEMLNTFVQNVCAVSGNDSSHVFPYGCRAYAPGEARYALESICNTTLVNPFSKTNILISAVTEQGSFSNYTSKCSVNAHKVYKSCKYGYYLYSACADADRICYTQSGATECRQCPITHVCTGGTTGPQNIDKKLYESCGEYYIGSLYQQMVRYALQNCTMSSSIQDVPSKSLLADIDMIMNDTRAKLVAELSKECTNMSGIWIDIPWQDENGDGKHDTTGDLIYNNFYTTTGANTLWGYCKQ